MDEIQKLLFVFDADTSNLDQKFTKVTKGAIEAQGAERDAYLQQLGIMQKLRVEAELLRKARERANDPKQVLDYSNRLKELTVQARNLTGALQPKQTTLFDSIKAGLGLGTGFSIVQGLQRAVGLMVEFGKYSVSEASKFEKLKVAYTNAFGSTESADKQLEMLSQFETKIPGIQESFLKLKNRGVEPTAREITQMGDFAKSQMKDFDQLAEAMLDAQTGEYERLKEFGIRAKTVGDNVTLSFRGVEKQMKKTDQEAIKEAIVSFGKLDGIVGSMAAQSETLSGIQAKVEVNFSKLGRVIGERTLPQLTAAGGAFGDWIQRITDSIEPQAALDREFRKNVDSVIAVQNELPRLVKRYDQLKAQKKLNKDEQKELNAVMQQVTQIVPLAAAEWDKYGKVLSLSRDEITAFTAAQKEQLKNSAEIKLTLAQQTQKELDGLNTLTAEQAKIFAKQESQRSKNSFFLKDIEEGEAFKKISGQVLDTQKKREKAIQDEADARRILNQLSTGQNIDQPKDDKAKGTTKTTTGDDGKAKDKAEKLRNAREKANEDILSELAKLNLDIEKVEEKDGFQSIERIKKRVALEIQAERAGFDKKKKELVRDKTFSQAEAERLYAPIYEALKRKESLLQINEIKKFKEEAAKVDKENNEKLISLTLDYQTEKLNLLTDSLQKENALLFDNAEKQDREIRKKFDSFRENLELDYKKGLMSVAETDLVALAEAAKKYQEQLLKISELEKGALENNVAARDNALLVLNQKGLEESAKANDELFKSFEIGRDKQEALKIQAETERYIRGQIGYAQYQKSITNIQKQYLLERQQKAVKEIENEIKIYARRIRATEDVVDGALNPDFVLNDKDLKAAKKEIERLKSELEKAKADVLTTHAGGKDTDNEAFKEKVNKFIEGYAAITNAALQSFKMINDAELNSIDRSLEAQRNRIEQAKNLRDRGNTEILDEEEKRFRILDEKRRKALARQQFLDRLSQLSAVGVGVAKAFAESGGKFTAVTIASSIAALVAGYSLVNSIVPQQPQRFNKGTTFVRRPFGVATGIDTIPAMLTEGERVIPTKDNSEYKDSLDILTSRKLSAKEAKKRLTEPQGYTDVDMMPGPAKQRLLNNTLAKRYELNYRKLQDVNAFAAKMEAKRVRTDDLLETQVSQNKEIIALLRGSKPSLSLNLDRKGFALSVSDFSTRENIRSK